MKSLVVLNECRFTDEQKKALNQHFKDVSFYSDTTSQDQAIKRASGKNIVVMDQFSLKLNEDFFKACPSVELIAINTTTYENLDISLLNKYGVKLVNMKEYATRDVAETALSMILALNQRFEIVHQVNTPPIDDISPGHNIVPSVIRHQLKGQKVGIVGLGKIGQELAGLCHSLGLEVLGFNRTPKSVEGVRFTKLTDLFRESDIIVLCLKYDPKTTKGFIDKHLLDLAKDQSIFISITNSNVIDMKHFEANSLFL